MPDFIYYYVPAVCLIVVLAGDISLSLFSRFMFYSLSTLLPSSDSPDRSFLPRMDLTFRVKVRAYLPVLFNCTCLP